MDIWISAVAIVINRVVVNELVGMYRGSAVLCRVFNGVFASECHVGSGIYRFSREIAMSSRVSVVSGIYCILSRELTHFREQVPRRECRLFDLRCDKKVSEWFEEAIISVDHREEEEDIRGTSGNGARDGATVILLDLQIIILYIKLCDCAKFYIHRQFCE